jgi:hypothetical protein
MGNIKISQLTPKGANLESTDLLEISEFDGSGYVTKSITGQEIIDAAAGGDFVPYTGATQNVDLGNEDLLVNEVFLYDGVNNNYGSIHFTDGDFHVQNGSGLPMLVVEDGFIQLHKTSFVQSNLYITGLSATRDHYLPNASGTIALTSDVATKQDILVSGTNIKTLNGASLLGSGGLSVEPSITSGTTSQYFRGDKTFQTLDKTAVGLANVDNTSDANKPVSTAQATAIGLKQDTLISGTNIKTINGSSVLGSGNLTISGGVTSVTGTAPIASSGGATPAISIATANTSTTGALSSSDWNTFNGKQNALTLTTTGTSGAATLVGATLNVPQYGGGGLQGIHVLLPIISGTIIPIVVNGSGTITVNTINNRMFAIPFIPARTFTTSNLYINVITLGVGISGRILIYSELNGIPNTKLYESASLDCSTTGIKTATTSFTFTAGTNYFIVTHFNGIAGVTGYQTSALAIIQSNGVNINSSYFVVATFGSAPSPFGASPNFNGNNIPAVYITAS